MGVGWEYEPQGFMIGDRPYLPDFLLDCGTWVEVKGDPERLDKGLMLAAAEQLPPGPVKHEKGPRLMVLGPIPRNPSPDADGDMPDWCWIGLEPHHEVGGLEFGEYINEWGFSRYHKNDRPWAGCGAFAMGDNWLVPRPSTDMEYLDTRGYDAARQARFEHGERG